MATVTPIVRQCARCGAKAVLAIPRWTPWFEVPLSDPPTADLVCQSCGVGTVLRNMGWSTLIFFVLAGLGFAALGSPFVAVSIFLERDLAAAGLATLPLAGLLGCCLAVASFVYRWWVSRRWPVVAAPTPLVRFPEPGAPRRCRCGQAAACQGVEPAIPRLETWIYRCGACGRTLRITGARVLGWNMMIAFVLTAMTPVALGFVAMDPLARWGELSGIVPNAVLAAVLVAFITWQLWLRSRHPQLPRSPRPVEPRS